MSFDISFIPYQKGETNHKIPCMPFLHERREQESTCLSAGDTRHCGFLGVSLETTSTAGQDQVKQSGN